MDDIDYDTIMRCGHVSRTFEFDFSGILSNHGNFSVAVTQEGVPDTMGTQIKFEARFESENNLSSKTDPANACPGDTYC